MHAILGLTDQLVLQLVYVPHFPHVPTFLHTFTLVCRLAILGLTDQLVHQRISRQKYLDWKRGIEAHLHQKQGLVVSWGRPKGGG